MTLQQWCFSWRGRLGRRDFWIWQAVWLLTTTLLFALAANDWLDTQMAAFGVVCLLWPASAVIVKRLHDRNRRGYWGFLVIVAWLLWQGTGACWTAYCPGCWVAPFRLCYWLACCSISVSFAVPPALTGLVPRLSR